MKNVSGKNAVSLFEFGMMKIEVPEEHELIRLGKELAWEKMEAIVGKTYSQKMGRKANSHRMMLGLEIAKQKYSLTDEETIERLQTDVALKVFCGHDNWHHAIPDSSSMTNFRKRLRPEDLQMLEEVNLKKFIRKAPKKRRHQVISDSTCVEANITYPTDAKLLSKVWDKTTEHLKTLRGKGAEVVIRGKRRVKSSIRSFNLQRKKGKETIENFNRMLIEESQKLGQKLEKCLKKVGKNLRKAKREKIERFLSVTKTILSQQKALVQSKAKRISHRIISLHAPELRPINRGKDGKKTEFGPKLAVNVIGGGLIQSSKFSTDNFSDTELVSTAIETHRKTFGRNPTELNIDRGGHSPSNHRLLEEQKIKDGVQYRGKVPKKANLPPPKALKRMRRQRSVVEAKIGTFKTKYGGNRIRYASKNAPCCISFGFIAMNGVWAMNH